MKKNPGFTLVESIIAVVIIALVIVAAAQLTQSSLRIARASMIQLTAQHLAEEGVELVRAIRDSAWLQNQQWRNGMAEDGLYILAENSRSGWELQRIQTQEEAEKITMAPGQEFSRFITLSAVEDTALKAPAMRVESAVLYQGKKVVLGAEFTDWKKGPL